MKNIKDRVFSMVEVGFVEDAMSRAYDIVNLFFIVINLIVSIALTFDDVRAANGGILAAIDAVTIAFFALDYVLRIWTADRLFPDKPYPKAILSYMVSLAGLVDLLSFLPFYLPAVFPGGTVVFRLFRVMRIFKLFRIGAYSDSLGVIKKVLYDKRQQLISALFIICTLMIGASLCMYQAEHEAQPEIFRNAKTAFYMSHNAYYNRKRKAIYEIALYLFLI